MKFASKVMGLIMCLLVTHSALSQYTNPIGQYYKMIQAYAPGLTGANDFLEINAGFRRQWNGVKGGPTTNFANVSGTVTMNRLNSHKYNSLRVSDLSPYARKNVKLGVGAYFANVSAGSYKSNRIMASSSTHVLIARDMYLSLGLSLGVFSERLDLVSLQVLYPDNDRVYQAYLNGGGNEVFFKSNVGLAVTSSRFYFSYTFTDLVNTVIQGYDIPNRYKGKVLHDILGGMRFSANERLDVVPNFFLRYTEMSSWLLDVGVRVRYMESLLLGLSYRNEGSIIGLLGFDFREIYSFGYCYEFKKIDAEFNALNTHEVTLGVKLFNSKRIKSIW